MDEQEMLQSAIAYHGPMLCQVFAEQNVVANTEDERHKLKLIKFIVKKRKWFFKPLKNSVQIPTAASTIGTFPIEMFGGFDKQARRRHFFANLRLGNIFIGKIINVKFNGYYKMLVLCKHGEDRKLDDLSLLVYLPKKKCKDIDEKKQVKEEIKAGDLYRVAVLTCLIEKCMIIVSDDIFPGIPIPKEVKLGKVSKQELPCYVGVDSKGQSLVDLLHRTKSFYNPSWTEELEVGFNIDRHRIYSLHEDLDGLDFPKESYAPELRKKQEHLLSEILHERGKAYYTEEKMFEAFDSFKRAIEINPKNVEAYVSRGIAYANSKKMPLAIDDLEKAVALEPLHALARKTLSKLFVLAAKAHEEQNNDEGAMLTLTVALNYDETNEEAQAALATLNEKEDSPIDTEASIAELVKKKLQLKDRLNDDEGDGLNDAEKLEKKCSQFLRDVRQESDKATSSRKKRHPSRHHHRHHHRRRPRSKPRSLSDRRRSPSVGRRSSSDEKRSSPDRKRSPSDRRRSPSDRKRSPSDRRRSPSDRRWSPSDRRWSPSDRRRSPSYRRRSPSDRKWSPSDRRRSPSYRRWSPSDRRRSPSDKRRSPSDRGRSPSYRRWSPSDRRRSPDRSPPGRRRSSDRRLSPRSRRWSTDRRRSLERKRSPGRRFSPPSRRTTPERMRKRGSSSLSSSSRSRSKTPSSKH